MAQVLNGSQTLKETGHWKISSEAKEILERMRKNGSK